MKKRWIIVIFVILLTCVGCNNANKYIDITEETESQTFKERFPDFVFNSNENPYYVRKLSPFSEGNAHITVSEQGIYFCNRVIDGSQKPWFYYDVNKKEAVPLCTILNCKHNDENCEAVFLNYKNTFELSSGEVRTSKKDTGFLYYKGKLYSITYDSKTGTKLISYNRNGTDMVIETNIEANPQFTPVGYDNGKWSIHNNKLIIFMYMVNDNNIYTYRYLISDLQTGQSTTLLEWTSTNEERLEQNIPDYSKVMVDGDSIYLLQATQKNYILWKYNTYDASFENVADITSILSDTAFKNYIPYMMDCQICNGNIYFKTATNNSIILLKYQLQTSKITQICDFKDCVDVQSEFSVDEQYIYTVDTNAERLTIIDAVNLNTVYEKQFENAGICISAVDPRFLILKISGIYFSKSEEFRENIFRDGYLLLDKQTIGSGNEDFEWMYMQETKMK